MERCGFGGEARLLPGCPKVGSLLVPQCQAKPVIPKPVPREGGTAVPGTPAGNPVVPKPLFLSPREGEQRHHTQHPCGHQFLLSLQMVSKLPLMKTICNLHLDKLEFFRLVHPETAMNFPPLYKEVFNSELQYSDPRES